MEGNAKFSHGVSTKEDVIPSYPRAQASQKSVGKFRTSAIDHMWEVSKKKKNKNKPTEHRAIQSSFLLLGNNSMYCPNSENASD